jgi:long-chain acyl-CoA synthetase
METLATFPQHLAQQFGPKQALLHKPGKTTEVWSFDRLVEQANKVAVWLQERGVEKGDRIILWGPNSPWWVAAYLGAMRLGAVAVPLDVRSGPDFAQRVVGQTEPKLALLAKTTKSSWDGTAPTYMFEELESLPETTTQALNAGVRPEDIAVLMFTSGTTGEPKGVILTHGNIMASVESTNQVVPNSPRFKLVSLLPLSHIFEQVVGLLLALRRGASVYYISSLMPATIFDALKEHEATAMLLVPGALQLFMSAIEREVAKQGKEKQWQRAQKIARYLPSPLRRMLFREVLNRLGGKLEFLVSGGAPIAPELIEKWELLGIPVLQGYGATEAASVISATNLRNRNPYTVGTAIPEMQIKVAPDGEVLIKGPNVTSGYWQNPKATEQAFEDGWYRTGDLGEIDSRGHLRLHGRKKDMIVLSNGQKVFPEDVERALKGVPGVTEAVVVGMPSEQGEQVYAALICDQSAPDPDSIVKQANAHLAPHQYVKGVTLWPESDFPRTHTLKVKKHEVLATLKKMLAEKEREKVASPV